MSDIRLLGITLTYNEEKLIPYVMPYYERMHIDKLIVFDNFSTDNTVKELLKYPFVEIRYFNTENEMNDKEHQRIKNNIWKDYVNDYDWCICCDFDEVLYTKKEFKDVLKEYEEQGFNIFRQCMLNIYSEKFPEIEDGQLVHEVLNDGVLWKDFDKNINWGEKANLFNLKKIKEMNYTEGNHREYPIGVEPNKPNIVVNGIAALHLKYIDYNAVLYKTYDYFLRRLKNTNKYEYMDPEDRIFLDMAKKGTLSIEHLKERYNKLLQAHRMTVEEFIKRCDLHTK